MMTNIIHEHLAKCSSTQDLLKEKLRACSTNRRTESNLENFLISTSDQSQGHGRNGNEWSHFPHNLAFSLNLTPNAVLTLTPLEIGVHLVNFLTTMGFKNLGLKWPNDLHVIGEGKVGGILCEKIESTVIVGIGINFSPTHHQILNRFPYPVSVLSNSQFDSDYQATLPLRFYQYALEHRMEREKLITSWQSHCVHLEKNVGWTEHGKDCEGIFKRLGIQGQAIILRDKELVEVWSGHLTII